MLKSIAALILALAVTVLVRNAHAQSDGDLRAPSAPPRPPTSAELGGLEFELDSHASDVSALMRSNNCAAACEALEAMQRSAEKICELDAGRRCVAARDKVDRSRRKLRDACPECLAATQDDRHEAAVSDPKPQQQSPPPPESKAAPGSAAARVTETEAAPVSAPAPGEASARGGCAACAVTAATPEQRSFAWLGLLLGAAAIAARRARR